MNNHQKHLEAHIEMIKQQELSEKIKNEAIEKVYKAIDNGDIENYIENCFEWMKASSFINLPFDDISKAMKTGSIKCIQNYIKKEHNELFKNSIEEIKKID